MARGLVVQPSGMQEESSQSNIWKQVRASQNQHLVQLLEASLQKEDRRLSRLVAATGNAKAKRRLEMHFNVERDRERKLFELVKQDHDVTLRAKMKAARVQKALSTISTTNKQPTDASQRPPPKPPKLRHASSSSDASIKKHPCHQSSQVVDIRSSAIPSRLRPLTTSSANNVARERLTPVQVDAFRMYVTQKLENAPKAKLRDSSSAWLTADNVHEHTTRMSSTLLVQKCHLLKQLHDIVTKQQRILLQDDQCTVRSAVSSYKSTTPTNTMHDYRYVPFASIP